MPLIGRSREMVSAEHVLVSDDGECLLFIGAPGVGKTALLRRLAVAHDVRIVGISRAERDWPYSAVSAICVALGPERSVAIEAILDAVALEPDYVVAERISRVLHAAVGDPVTVLIDDVDRVDAESAAVLSYLFSRIHGTGIRLIATARPSRTAHVFDGVPRAWIRPLDRVAALELTRVVLGSTADPGVRHIVAAFTGGNAAAIGRVRLTERESRGSVALTLPLRLVDDHGGRADLPVSVQEADADVRRLLDVLAMAPFSARQAVIDQDPAFGLRIDDLIDDGTVLSHTELLRIADPTVRGILHASLDASERRSLHAAAAEAHHVIDPRLERWHTSFVTRHAEDDALLLASADRLVRAGETDAAVEFAERAVHARAATAVRNSMLIDLADTFCVHGHFSLAMLYLGRVTDIASERRGPSAVLTALRAGEAMEGLIDDARVDAYVDANTLDDPRGCARLLAETARLHLRRGEYGSACVRSAAAVEMLSHEPPFAYRLLAAVCTVAAGSDPVAFDEVAELARVDGASELSPMELSLVIRFLTMTEQYARCARLAAAHLQRMPPMEPLWAEEIHLCLAINRIRSGDYLAARDAVAVWRRFAADERAADTVAPVIRAAALSLDPSADAGIVHDLVTAAREVAIGDAESRLDIVLLTIEARGALDGGRFGDAARALLEAHALRRRDADPAEMRLDADLVESLWLDGQHERARQHLVAFEEAAVAHPTRWSALGLARARAVCDSDAEVSDSFAAAIAGYEADDSRDEYRRLRAARDRCRGVDRLRRPSGPVVMGAPSPLTPHEREVVRLVRGGMRNREIAAELFVSLRTVELRLTRIYRKVGVASRSQLVAIMASR